MTFKLEIEVTNDAFNDGAEGRAELARVLREAIEKLDMGYDYCNLRDSNGNVVGKFILG